MRRRSGADAKRPGDVLRRSPVFFRRISDHIDWRMLNFISVFLITELLMMHFGLDGWFTFYKKGVYESHIF